MENKSDNLRFFSNCNRIKNKKSSLLILIIFLIVLFISFNIKLSLNNYFKQEDKKLFKYGDKFNFYAHLSNRLDRNFTDAKKLIWKLENIIYDNKTVKEFNFKTNNWEWEWQIDVRSNDKELKYSNLRPNKDKYIFFSKFNPIINVYHLNTTVSIDSVKNSEIYLHYYIIKLDHLNNNLEPILYRIKKLNLSNWISNYTINLIDHRENINQLSKSSFSELCDSINDNYSPAISIDNTDNNYELINIDKTKLPFNLKFNQINFCQFIIYSCNQSSKDSQLNQICFEESAKLSTNLIYFLYHDFPFKNDFQFDTTVYTIGMIIGPTLLFYDLFCFPYLKNLKGLSLNLFIFDFFKSFIFLIYELNRFPYLKCDIQNSEYFLTLNLLVIIGWLYIFLINLFKLYKIFNLQLDQVTRKYDNLSFKYLSFIMLPLFIIYSYYTFNYKYHQNWYSYLLNTLYGYFLNFGFITMVSQVYINYKFNCFPIHFHRYFFKFLVFKLLIVTMEDFIDYQYEYREPYKFIYFRDELFAFIFIIQNWYYDKKSSIRNDLYKSKLSTDHLNINEIDNKSDNLDSSDNTKNIILKKNRLKTREELIFERKYLFWAFYSLSTFLIYYKISQLDNSFEINNRNLIKENDRFNFRIYLTNLTDNKFDRNSNNSNRLFTGQISKFIYGNLNIRNFDNYQLWNCKFNETSNLLANCKLIKEYNTQTKYLPITNTNIFNTTISIDLTKNSEIYLHYYIIKLDHLNNNLEPTLYRIKKLNLSNWISNYTINLIDHRENINQLSKSSFSELCDLINDNYSPAISIDNTDNNYELININKTKLPFNLKFNQINFCQFIIYSCNQSSKDSQLNQICFEESSKLSTNLFYFFLFDTPDWFYTKIIKIDEINSFSILLILLLPILTILPVCILFEDLQFAFINFHLSNLNGLSVKLILFDCFKSIIFLLYELNRFPYLKCNFYTNLYRHYLGVNAFIIFCWFIIVLANLYKSYKIFNNRKTYDQVTRKYDNLSFKYLSFAMLPLFVAYSYYTFNYKYHQNCYSYLLNTLYGYFLNFGFMTMVSQVYINYKLKIPNYLKQYLIINSFKMILIGLEDIVDLQFKWRESYKFLYLREELFYFIFLIQIFYQKSKITKFNDCKQN